MALPAAAQRYTVKGTVPKGINTVYMRHDFLGKIDSTTVSDGKFCFSGETDGTYIFAEVFYDNLKDGTTAVVLDGDVTVDIINHEASGTAENEAFTPWAKCFRTFDVRWELIQETFPSGYNISELDDWIDDQLDGIRADQEDLMVMCCKANPDRIFPAMYLYAFAASNSVCKNKNRRLIEQWAKQGNQAYMQIPLAEKIKAAINKW